MKKIDKLNPIFLSILLHLMLILAIFSANFFTNKNNQNQDFTFNITATNQSKTTNKIAEKNNDSFLEKKISQNFDSANNQNVEKKSEEKIKEEKIEKSSLKIKTPNQQNQIIDSEKNIFLTQDVIHFQLPEITAELRKKELNLIVIAEFDINSEGIVKNVDLKKMTSDPKMNFILIKNLKKWRFKPTKSDFKKEIKINLSVY